MEISATPRGELRLRKLSIAVGKGSIVEISATPRGELRHEAAGALAFTHFDSWRSPLHPEGNCDP